MKLNVFGESHSPEIGVEIDGLPSGLTIDLDELQTFLDRRAPGRGQGGLSTPRHEPDRPEFASGVTAGSDDRHLVTDGARLRAVIRNTNIRPQDYANTATVPRPGHADYASWLKTGLIPSGGGKWSGRLTAPLCIAGGIALQELNRRGVSITSSVKVPADVPEGDSVGGVVELVAKSFPAGIGDVGTAGVESRLAVAFFGIPAVKGVEFGDGFRLAEMRGSEANDAFEIAAGETGPRVRLRTNHCGGILGGVSVGMPIVARLAFKPTPSIALPQDSVDLVTLKSVKLTVKGRHDRCVAFRGAVAAEAAMAFALLDLLLESAT